MINILKVIQNSDNRFLFDIRRKLHIRKNFTNQKLNKYIDHLKWYNFTFGNNKKKLLFIIQLKTTKVGYIYYNLIKKNYFISIAIEENYQNQGIAKIALKESEKFFKKKKILAYLFLRNKKSLNFFRSAGFKIYKTNSKYIFLEKLIK